MSGPPILGRTAARGFDNPGWSDRIVNICIETLGGSVQRESRRSFGDGDGGGTAKIATSEAVVAAAAAAETPETVWKADESESDGKNEGGRALTASPSEPVDTTPATSSSATPLSPATSSASDAKKRGRGRRGDVADADEKQNGADDRRTRSKCGLVPALPPPLAPSTVEAPKSTFVWRRLHISTAVVASNSIVLERMLTNGMSESRAKEIEIFVRDIDCARAFVAMIRLMYDPDALARSTEAGEKLSTASPGAVRTPTGREEKDGATKGRGGGDDVVAAGNDRITGLDADEDCHSYAKQDPPTSAVCAHLLRVLLVCDMYEYETGIRACERQLAHDGCMDTSVCERLLSWRRKDSRGKSHSLAHLHERCPRLFEIASSVVLAPWKTFDAKWSGPTLPENEWYKLPLATVIEILSSDRLEVKSENTVFQTARMWWIRHTRMSSTVVTEADCIALLRCVRLLYCTRAFLLDVVADCQEFSVYAPTYYEAAYRAALEFALVDDPVRRSTATAASGCRPRASHRSGAPSEFEWLTPNLAAAFATGAAVVVWDFICDGYVLYVSLDRRCNGDSVGRRADSSDCLVADAKCTLGVYCNIDVDRTRVPRGTVTRPLAVNVEAKLDAIRPSVATFVGSKTPVAPSDRLPLVSIRVTFVARPAPADVKLCYGHGRANPMQLAFSRAIDPLANHWLASDTGRLRIRGAVAIVDGPYAEPREL